MFPGFSIDYFFDPEVVDFKVRLPGVSDDVLDEMTPMEIILGESLLTPGLQTSVRVHSNFHNIPIKNLDEFKKTAILIELERPILAKFGFPTTMLVNQRCYRLDRRRMMNSAVEEFVLHACDQSLLNDAKSLVSKLWKCTTPSAVVRDVLGQCAGVTEMEIEPAPPARDYMAENIHPFQVVAQQATAALADGNDPSFVHYMTYEHLGTHHFKSLNRLTELPPIIELEWSDAHGQQGYKNPFAILTHSFPCDFDLLSDLLNGVDENGQNFSTLATVNPLMKMFNMFGNQTVGCGIGQGVPKVAMTNEGSAQNQNACPDYTKTYLLKRQARMSLLEQDKIALRVTVPWSPIYHAGKTIQLNLKNKLDPSKLLYGSGKYLIVSMIHNIKYGSGYATTTMDCVAQTAGKGIV